MLIYQKKALNLKLIKKINNQKMFNYNDYYFMKCLKPLNIICFFKLNTQILDIKHST